jgi:hypothetical protein
LTETVTERQTDRQTVRDREQRKVRERERECSSGVQPRVHGEMDLVKEEGGRGVEREREGERGSSGVQCRQPGDDVEMDLVKDVMLPGYSRRVCG